MLPRCSFLAEVPPAKRAHVYPTCSKLEYPHRRRLRSIPVVVLSHFSKYFKPRVSSRRARAKQQNLWPPLFRILSLLCPPSQAFPQLPHLLPPNFITSTTHYLRYQSSGFSGRLISTRTCAVSSITFLSLPTLHTPSTRDGKRDSLSIEFLTWFPSNHRVS